MQINVPDIDEMGFAEFGYTIDTFFSDADSVAEFICSAYRDGFDFICQCQFGVCEYCGQKHILQSAHIEERPVIIKKIIDQYYCKGADLYEVDLEDFFVKFKDAHMPISDHIFFLCKECHEKLDNKHTISVNDIKNKRSTI